MPCQDVANGSEYSTLLSLRVAFCAPSQCGTRVLEAALVHTVGQVNKALRHTAYRLQARLPTTSLNTAWRHTDAGDCIVM